MHLPRHALPILLLALSTALTACGRAGLPRQTVAAPQLQARTPAARQTPARQAPAARAPAPAARQGGSLPALTDSALEDRVGDQQLYAGTSWRDTWIQLSSQLQKDGLDPYKTNTLFMRLNEAPSHLPMGTKVRELYTNHFLPKPKPQPAKPVETKLGIPGPWFKGVVTEANARTCREFIGRNAVAFASAELKYGVPTEVAAALLFVETRLGTSLGKHDAFFMLASMAVTRAPESIPEYMAQLPGADAHREWIRDRMRTKADWAYNELKALLRHCYGNGIDASRLKGSIYGAIGMCQFMPSNLPRYGADGDADGVVNIFTTADAAASLGNYLKKNGWRPGLTMEQQTKVLKTYNSMDIYAHTILALAKTISQGK